MKKQSREIWYVIGMFTLLSIWGNHAHLWYAIVNRVWWYLGFYCSTYVLSIVTIYLLAFVLEKASPRAKHKRRRGVDALGD